MIIQYKVEYRQFIMEKRITVFISITVLLFCTIHFASAQQNGNNAFRPAILPVPGQYIGEDSPELPSRILNHNKAFFPPLMNQHLPTCGQAAAVYNCFAYEYNRIVDGDASQPEYQYPVSFTYNYLGGGYGWYGASAFDSWNMMKIAGHPSVAEFGCNEDTTGRIWMSGYNKYLRAMQRQVKNWYALDVTNENDLSLLKHYLNDHLDGSEHGGVAMIYSNSSFLESDGYLVDSVLAQPYDTVPMMESFYGSPTHAMAITGYVDTAHFDFNGDGMSTDSLDINNDGVVDMWDNEKFFWIISNTWGNNYPGISQSNGTFLVRYHGLSQVWNQQAFIVEAEHVPEQKLTCRLDFEHANRNHLSLKIGIAEDTDALYPERITDYPLVNFQGGPHNLPALIDEPDNQQLVMGLNYDPLLKYMPASGKLKLFLIIENNGDDEGKVNTCSFFHYPGNSSDNAEEYECRRKNIKIPGKDTIQFSQIIYGVNHDADDNNLFKINTASTHDFFTGDSLNLQLQADNAQEPAYFEFENIREYQTEKKNSDIPMSTVSANYSQVWVPLDFEFPFGGRVWDSVCLDPGGQIYFDSVVYEAHPYMHQPETAPATDFEIMAFNDVFKGSLRKRVFYETFQDSLYVHWMIEKINGNMEVENSSRITAILRKNGEILLQQHPDEGWNHSMQIRTLERTYLSKVLPLGESSGHNACLFKPANERYTQAGITINKEGRLTGYFEEAAIRNLHIRLSDSNNQKYTKHLKLRWADLEDARARIYPNPTYDKIHFDIILETAQEVKIDIYDQYGKWITRSSVWCEKGITDISTSKQALNLSNGMYFCKLQSSEFNEILKLIIL